MATWALCLFGCATQAEPAVLSRVRDVALAPASSDAEVWAPQARAEALQLEERAKAELASGDSAAAEALAEHAIAAHEHAWALTRVARAERRRAAAETELIDLRKTAAELQAQLQQLNAEAQGLEQQARVARASLPAPPGEAAAGERREARRKAAEALITQARLLCVGARLLGEKQAISDAVTRLDDIEQELQKGRGAELFETAVQVRSTCLELISAARRQAPASSAPASKTGDPELELRKIPDRLLSELSAKGSAPSRDDRGVVVTLRNLFDEQASLKPEARKQLAELAGVSQEHPEFPVLLVGHSGGTEAREQMAKRLARLEAELKALGVTELALVDAGQRQPLLPPELPGARDRNARIELVFVAPSF